jgi:cadmium resistance protein CadD (predicted permease)
MAVLGILAVLFISLIVIIPLIEKSSVRISPETQRKFAKWIIPLVFISLIVQLFMFL